MHSSIARGVSDRRNRVTRLPSVVRALATGLRPPWLWLEMRQKLQHVNRRLTAEERARDARIRESAMKDFPPKSGAGRKPASTGIAARVRQARELQGLTWYALEKRSATANQATIRDIEQGKPVHGGVRVVAEAAPFGASASSL